MIDFKYYPPTKYTSFSIYYNDFYHPYGTSIFDPVRSIAKQLLLTEAALSIYRMTRAPLRYKFLVEVGGLPEKNVRGMLQSIKDSINRERVISDQSTKSIDTIPDLLAPEENFWIPVVGGTPWLDIVPIEGANLEPFIGDVEYFRKKFISGLRIPPSYLAQEEGTSTRALLTLEDINFTRSLRKYQRDINVALTDINDNNLLLAGYPELMGQCEIQLPPPQNLEDNIRVENLTGKLGTAGEFSGLFPNVPKLWIMRNIVCLNQDEIDDMENTIAEQSKYKIFAENKPGEIKAEGQEDIGGGMGGLGDFSTDVGPDIEGMETGDETLEDTDFGESMEELGSADLSEPVEEGEINL
jgi:hypothetical protein